MSSRLQSSLLTDQQLPEEGSQSANDSVELAPQQEEAKDTGNLLWLKLQCISSDRRWSRRTCTYCVYGNTGA